MFLHGRKLAVATAAGLAAVALTAAPLAAQAAPAVPTAKKYANCTALHKDFKYGVAKSKAAAKKQVKDGYHMPAYGPNARGVYWQNYRSLDRDRDGTACEA